ncbi:hypothetical protein GCM10010495_39620 [Kitasatospora herbaricolor]|nr:hypothetical protein GCM10010495_39620 [Kitasatospora herbaricolor]
MKSTSAGPGQGRLADVSPRNQPRRAQVVLSPFAEEQLAGLSAGQTQALDRVLAVLSVRPDLGEPRPDGRLRLYRDEVDHVLVVYHVTVLRTVVVVGYLEVD